MLVSLLLHVILSHHQIVLKCVEDGLSGVKHVIYFLNLGCAW